ncbi:hypothetical protein GGX14DRAFT_555986 [Mycena pura]|uniref:PI-PLC Y-box domain-containing protein n=1 Tax=Mycena pura TaxID=153505 RepID=A0AAD6YRY9_9AGAR|nr:hypothetical protein GGX14DRAFT_555986 [Mycena pura]
MLPRLTFQPSADPNVYIADSSTALKPERRVVERRHPHPGLSVPSHVWVLPPSDAPLPVLSLTANMIRQEVHDSIVAILNWIRKMNATKDAASASEPPPSPMKISRPGSPDNDEEPDDEETPFPVDMYAIEFVPGPGVSQHTEYRNPFVDNDITLTGHGVIITGEPGIGKTSSLHLIFNLRMALNLPTLFMEIEREAIVWCNGSLRQITNLNSIHIRALPFNTWCLIDSNTELEKMPRLVDGSGLFIVQASSPRASRMHWRQKRTGTAHYYLMKPWTCGELIAGIQLQENNKKLISFSEKTYMDFHVQYGGSARDTYTGIGDTTWPTIIREAAQNLNRANIIKALYSEPANLPAFDDDVSHILFSAYPLTDTDRRQFRIAPSSAWALQEIFARLNDHVDLARKELFEICIGVSSPGPRSIAADLFDRHYHNRIIAGGVWALRPMIPPPPTKRPVKNRGFKTAGPPDHILCAHRSIIIQSNAQSPPPPPSPPVPVPCVDFDPAQPPSVFQVGVYYRPLTRCFATFDSFYVDRLGHAIGFQASIGSKHDAKESGLEWLKDQGIDHVTYVYVSPVQDEGREAKIMIPVNIKFDYVYHMQIPF